MTTATVITTQVTSNWKVDALHTPLGIGIKVEDLAQKLDVTIDDIVDGFEDMTNYKIDVPEATIETSGVTVQYIPLNQIAQLIYYFAECWTGNTINLAFKLLFQLSTDRLIDVCTY